MAMPVARSSSALPSQSSPPSAASSSADSSGAAIAARGERRVDAESVGEIRKGVAHTCEVRNFRSLLRVWTLPAAVDLAAGMSPMSPSSVPLIGLTRRVARSASLLASSCGHVPM